MGNDKFKFECCWTCQHCVLDIGVNKYICANTGEKPDATIKSALPDLSTHVLDLETITYLANVFESTLKRLCEVAIVKSRNDMTHSALAKIRYKV